MRTFSILKGAFIISCFSLVTGCQKELPDLNSSQQESLATQLKKPEQPKKVSRAYRDSFEIDSLVLLPDYAAGFHWSDPDAPAWYHGTGKGNATHMGNARTFFNSYTLREEGFVNVYNAPVDLFYHNDIQQFNIPPELEVSAVQYDDKGNSIWFKTDDQGMDTWHSTPSNIVEMGGKMHIVGGTGKFEGASGETDFYARFDQASFNFPTLSFKVAQIWQYGRIEY